MVFPDRKDSSYLSQATSLLSDKLTGSLCLSQSFKKHKIQDKPKLAILTCLITIKCS